MLRPSGKYCGIGRLAFVPAIVKTAFSGRPTALSVIVDGEAVAAAAVVVAKGRYYAGPFSVAPNASITEPSFNAVLLRSGDSGAALGFLVGTASGTIPWMPGVEIRRCKTVEIAGPEGSPVQADGEIVGTVPMTIAIAERPLQLIWP